MRPLPTRARMSAIALWTKAAGSQVSEHSQTRVRKLARSCLPAGVWTTSGWNWMPKRPSGPANAA